MNHHQFCYHRDSEVISSIQEMGVLDLYLIKYLHFPSVKTARRRMEILAEKKKVNRIRPSIDVPYHYFVGKRPTQLEHRTGINYTRLYLANQFKSWEKLYSWEYEPQYYEILRPDGFMTIENSIAKKLTCCFVEFDRAFDPFDKVEKYNQLYSTNGFKSAWWASKVDRFPAVIVVSENVERAKKQLKYNKCGIEFRFIGYLQVKEGFIC